MLRLAGLLLAFTLLGAGCSSKQPSLRASKLSPPASSPAPQLSKYPQSELAKQPCLALDAHDLAALGITAAGKEESSKNGRACAWNLGGQNVDLNLDLPLSYAQTMTEGGRVTQVPVGQHQAVQAEFQAICFIFVALTDTQHLVGATTIPDATAPQEGACPAGASVVSAALTHIG